MADRQATVAACGDDRMAPGQRLRFLGPGDPDHLLVDSSYYLRSGQIWRATSRQLFAYLSSEDVEHPSAVFTPVPDAALCLPTIANKGLSEDHLVYTIRLRTGIFWDTVPAREVIADDFVRGLECIADRVTAGDVRSYFIDTMLGMDAYCQAYDDLFGLRRPTPKELAAFRRRHRISGLQAVDDKTLVIRLKEPANDFLNLLALGFASAVPEELSNELVDSEAFRRRFVSSGPYRIGRGAAAKAGLVLEPNPNWRRGTDPIRHRAVEAIYVQPEQDVGSRRDHIARGDIEAAWPFTIVSWRNRRTENWSFPSAYPGFTLNPYLVFNLQSPNARHAMGNLKVRQAIAYAIDKAAIGEIFGALHGVAVELLHSVIPPGSLGHRAFDLYPTPKGRGDPAAARRLLAEAGYPEGITLNVAVRDIGLHLDVMRSIASDLARCGIALRERRYSQQEYYGSLLTDPANAEAGEWDIAEAGWTPDWFGNNGRCVFRQLFRTDRRRGTMNFGCYSNPKVDALIARALRAFSLSEADALWHAADGLVMKDLPVLPILAFACQCCAARTGASGWPTWSATVDE